jgi:AcrR family transcriptional regulator
MLGGFLMDLRIIKTRKNIREAFLKLRSTNALEKIKVTELCELALINKTTFYKHYQDIYAFSEEIENETISSIMGNFEHMNSLLTDPDSFIKGLYYTFKYRDELIMTLFSGRMDTLIDKVQRQLIIHYPSLSDMPEKVIMQSFLLWGATHVLMESNYDETVLLDTLSKVTKPIINLIDIQNI